MVLKERCAKRFFDRRILWPMLVVTLLVLQVSRMKGNDAEEAWSCYLHRYRMEVVYSNQTDSAVRQTVVIPVRDLAARAQGFPGKGIVVTSHDSAGKLQIVPSQLDDFDRSGMPDEVAFGVELAPNQRRSYFIYFDPDIEPGIPYPERTHAAHFFGKKSDISLFESEEIAYMSYGGFALDVIAKPREFRGLSGVMMGWLQAHQEFPIGADILHLGKSLGLGGPYLSVGQRFLTVPFPPTSDQASSQTDALPKYYVLAKGPVRAVVEASVEHWETEIGLFRLWERFSIHQGESVVRCELGLKPIRGPYKSYRVGFGMVQLSHGELFEAPGVVAAWGSQDEPDVTAAGVILLGLLFNAGEATYQGSKEVVGSRNHLVEFSDEIKPGEGVRKRFFLVSGWRKGGIEDWRRFVLNVHQQLQMQLDYQIGPIQRKPS
jgi:hypothetical protein